jgi:uncharacterized YkwD family protein/spore coat assembly protein SafA
MKKITTVIVSLFVLFCAETAVHAQAITYVVRSGDSMWKIAVRHQIGVSEIISANRHIANPNMIYPGQKLTIPNINDVKALENEVIRLVNVERSKHGLAPLKANWELSRIARIKSQDMKNKGYFSHYSPTYGSPFDMMKKFGFKFYSAGENIAMGQRTPQEVMNGWMNSPGHRANILKADFKEIGVGLARDGSMYWTQMFMTR